MSRMSRARDQKKVHAARSGARQKLYCSGTRTAFCRPSGAPCSSSVFRRLAVVFLACAPHPCVVHAQSPPVVIDSSRLRLRARASGGAAGAAEVRALGCAASMMHRFLRVSQSLGRQGHRLPPRAPLGAVFTRALAATASSAPRMVVNLLESQADSDEMRAQFAHGSQPG